MSWFRAARVPLALFELLGTVCGASLFMIIVLTEAGVDMQVIGTKLRLLMFVIFAATVGIHPILQSNREQARVERGSR